MLLQFTFKNFRSFKDENTLDMRATKVKELSYHVRTAGKEKILPITAIYGANASGKSNVIGAYSYFVTNIINGINFNMWNYLSFFFDKNHDDNIFFEVLLYNTNTNEQYKYGYIISKDKCEQEWLYIKKKSAKTFNPIFKRVDNNISMFNIDKVLQKGLQSSIQKHTLVLTLGNLLNINICKNVYMLFVQSRIIDSTSYHAEQNLKQIPKSVFDDSKIKESLIKYINSFDNSIVDIIIEQSLDSNIVDYNNIKTVHQLNGTKQRIEFPLYLESTGTCKMFDLFLTFYFSLKIGNILMIDELNTKLHPLLIRAIINLFADPETNPNNAQLIFTTHDVWLMDADTLRRDEIWFTEKNSEGISELYSFVDIKGHDGKTMRKDLNFMKNYMLGKFGGVPNLKQFQIEVGNNNGQE